MRAIRTLLFALFLLVQAALGIDGAAAGMLAELGARLGATGLRVAERIVELAGAPAVE